MTATVQVFSAATLAALKTAIEAGTALTTAAVTQIQYQVVITPEGKEYSALVWTFSA